TRDKMESFVRYHENVHFIPGMVEDIQFDSETGQFKLKSEGRVKVYDYVFLTMGMLRYSDHYSFEGEERYIQDAYPVEERLNKPAGDTAIIGSGMSYIDCVRYHRPKNKKERVFICSRSGEMQSVRGAHADKELQYFTKETLHSLVENDEIPLPLLKQLFL